MSANTWTIAAARDALRKGEISATDLTMACLTAIDAGDALGAFVHKTPEIALDQARAADARIKAGDAPSMCGIPLGIKDLFCTKGVPSQAASNILGGFKPEYESTVTTKLFDAGAVMLGKLNMDEFAMGSSNETSCYGNAVNPWKVDDRKLTPGGSSGGHRGDQADLWARQPLGDRGLCVIAGSGGADDQDGAGCGDLPAGDGGARSEGFDIRRPPGP